MDIALNRTMSSLEIAKLTDKDHKNVLRDIANVLEEAGIGQLKFESSYLSPQNKSLPCFNLPREECDLVISGYSVKYRLAIIKRWHELEKAKTPLERAREQVVYFERLEAIEIEKKFLEVTLDLAHDWSSIKRMEIRDGKNYYWLHLRNYSNQHSYEVNKVFDQNYGEVNSYHRDVWLAVYGVDVA